MIKFFKELFTVKSDLERYIVSRDPQSISDVEAAIASYDERQRLLNRSLIDGDVVQYRWLLNNY